MTKPEIVEFLQARLNEWELASYLCTSKTEQQLIRDQITAQRAIMEIHKNWPVMLESPPEFDTEHFNMDLNKVALRVRQHVEWITMEEYVKRFGKEPPTTAILRHLAMPWRTHPDFQAEWWLM